MSNEETREDTDSLENETVEEVTETEVEDTDEKDNQTDWESEAKKWKAIAERTKRKATKTGKRADLETPDATPSGDVDERILKSQGMDDELLKELKRVARFNEQDLITAKSDPMYVAIQERIERERADKAAALGASKGSGQGKPKKDVSSPGLSADEHKRLWKQKVGL